MQSEYGDIYKVSLTYSEKTVSEVKVKYFDTLPPCISICVLKTGFLFAASEFGNHALYQFAVRGSPGCLAQRCWLAPLLAAMQEARLRCQPTLSRPSLRSKESSL